MASVSETQGTARTVTICHLDELELDIGRAFVVAGREIAVFHTRNRGVCAIDNICPHQGGPLADGMLAEGKVVCPLHMLRFDLETGQCDQPGRCDMRTYTVQVNETGHVQLTVPLCADL